MSAMRCSWIVPWVLTLAATAGSTVSAETLGDDPPANRMLVAGSTPPAKMAVSWCRAPRLDTFGITFDGESLWVIDGGTDIVYPTLNKYDPETCALTAYENWPSANPDPQGLTWDGANLWVADVHTRSIYPNRNFSSVLAFPSPGVSLRDLAWDGTHLWATDYDCTIWPGCPSPYGRLYKMTLDGSIVGSYPSPTDNPAGLTFDGFHLWYADYSTQTIYKLDPSTLAILDSFASPGQQPSGLAWDGRYLWVALNDHDMLFRYDVGDPTLIFAGDFETGEPTGWDVIVPTR